MAHEWWNAAAAMRNDAAATNDRPYKLVMPKKAALAAAGVEEALRHLIALAHHDAHREVRRQQGLVDVVGESERPAAG